MNILILGGVAAGTKTAAKLKREDRSLNVTILTKDKDISYACLLYTSGYVCGYLSRCIRKSESSG